MRARVFCRTSDLAGRTFEISNEATIGRSKDNTIVLPVSVISGHHARLSVDGPTGRYALEDLDSFNGTRLDGLPVRRRVLLGDLHVITFAGLHDFIFQVAARDTVPAISRAPGAAAPAVTAHAAPAASPPPTDRPAVTISEGKAFRPVDLRLPPPLNPPGAPGSEFQETPQTVLIGDNVVSLPAFEPPHLVPVATGWVVSYTWQGTPVEFDLPIGCTFIGRATSCQLALPDTALSRQHATITVESDRASIADLGSENGTFVDGVRITGSIALKDGSVVTMAGNVLHVRRRS